MSKRIIIDGNFLNQYRVAVVNSQNKIEDIEYETGNLNQIKGNIYLAKIVRVEPGLQAAFIDYGEEKNGFLPFSEIHPDYYNIPVGDRDKIMEKMAKLEPISLNENANEDSLEANKSASFTEIDLDLDLAQIEKLIDDGVAPYLEVNTEDTEIEIIDEKGQPSKTEYKQYKIQEVIKRGQIILVQAQKEERGNKGASFTSYISLAGKYCVLMPNSEGSNGISRRIQNQEERRRLKEIINKISFSEKNKSASVIIRTAGVGRSVSEIKRDYEYLISLWNKVRETTLKSKAPAFVHMEEGIILKTIRDYYDNNVKEIIIQGDEAYSSAKEFMKNIVNNDIGKVKQFNAIVPIFTDQKIEEQISSLYQQNVHLPSGGYIVINPTEALTSIDVNSGKSTSERNIEETALKTNLEAAKEIARQAKLRDISGLIVVDFIDMSESRNRKIIERSLKEFMSRDRARVQIGNISTFGLLEMSRQRLRSTFLESHSKICHHCNGKGIVRADEANAILILRTIENEISQIEADIINVYANQNVIMYLLNYKRNEINIIEDKYGVKCNFLIDSNATSDGFSLEKITLPAFAGNSFSHNDPLVSRQDVIDDVEKKEQQIDNEDKAFARKKKWRSNDSDVSSNKPSSNKPVSAKEAPVTSNANLVETAEESTQEVKKKPKYRNRNFKKKSPQALDQE